MRRYLIIILSVLSLCSCDSRRQRNAFIETDDIRLQIGKNIQFTYNPLTCQLSFNRDKKEFRAQTDNTSDYFIVSLDEIPVQMEQNVTADIVWTTPIDILHRNNLALRVVRLEGDRVWLWSDSAQIGLSIRILD